MKLLGTFTSKRWGRVTVLTGKYADGALAVVLEDNEAAPLAKLSVNMDGRSLGLPKRCFYAKSWSENEVLAREALESGLFKVREDLPAAASGYVVANVWEILE